MQTQGNIHDLSGIAHDAQQEYFQTLLSQAGTRLERIVSHGHATPPGVWYDQEGDEWVLLLSGAARLRLENQPEPLDLQPGDYVWLPAHCRHRVEWTDGAQATVWLALHLSRA
ncbi:MAG: cupin domain-containing protein [Methylococcaceae bacterium]|nr:MAG: cupin domain-containing protein [Methylococcaceae bacterium]